MPNEPVKPASESAKENEKVLLQLAESFDPAQRHRSVLYSYQRGILLLRAKRATYQNIIHLLKQVGVATSLFSVSRFCRKHRAAIRKLRVQIESRNPPTDTTTPLALDSGLSSGSPSDQSGTGSTAKSGSSAPASSATRPTTRRTSF